VKPSSSTCTQNANPADSRTDSPQAPPAQKRLYRPPSLITYGPIRKLTHAGSGTGTESGPNPKGKCGGGPKRPCV